VYTDVITQYAFARGEHHLEAEDFDPWMIKAGVSTACLSQIAKQMYWVLWIVLHIPELLAHRLDANGKIAAKAEIDSARADTRLASRFLKFKRASTITSDGMPGKTDSVTGYSNTNR
jgi:hypothetical protein